MFSLKIAFKGKNILLGKGIESFERIQQDLNNRFPGELPYGIVISYQGQILKEFRQVEEIVKSSKSKSNFLKLTVQPREQKEDDVQKKENDESDNSFILNKSGDEQQDQKECKIQEPKKEEKKIEEIFIKCQSEISEPSMNLENAKIQQELNNSVCQNKRELSQIKKQENNDSFIEGKKELSETNSIQQKVIILKNDSTIRKLSDNDSICLIEKKQTQINNTNNNDSSLIKQKYESQNDEHSIYKEKHGSLIMEQSKNETINGYVNNQDVVDFSSIRSKTENDLYFCMFCEGRGLCKFCLSTGNLKGNNRFMRLINDIVETKIEERMKNIQRNIQKNIVERMRLEEAVLRKESFEKKFQNKCSDIQKIERKFSSSILSEKPMNQIKFYVEDLNSNPRRVIVGEEFQWIFIVNLKDEVNLKHQIEIIDEEGGATMPISFRNQSQIKVGPFVSHRQGKYNKIFRLFYFNNKSEMQFFGPKFGFTVFVDRNQNKKKLENKYRLKIEQIKKGYKVFKDTEYIVEKLSSMGITQQNYEESMEMLPDILQVMQ